MYKLADHGVIRIVDGAVILPRQDGWDAYMQYITDGNAPSPPDALPPRPLEELRAGKLAAVRSEAYRRLTVKWPLLKQINSALGIGTLVKKTQLISDITNITAASNAAEAAIVAATTENELNSVVPNWPVI